MKEKIIEMMEMKEGFYTLLSHHKNLSQNEKEEFWAEIRNLAMNGTILQRYLALGLISADNADLVSEILPQLIDTIDICEDIDIVSPILAMIADHHYYHYTDFCVRVFEYAKLIKNEEVHSYAARCLLVIDWSFVLDDMKMMINQKDKLAVVDNMAFFRFTHKAKEWRKLMKMFDENQKTYVNNLLPEIKDREKNHYRTAQKM